MKKLACLFLFSICFVGFGQTSEELPLFYKKARDYAFLHWFTRQQKLRLLNLIVLTQTFSTIRGQRVK